MLGVVCVVNVALLEIFLNQRNTIEIYCEIEAKYTSKYTTFFPLNDHNDRFGPIPTRSFQPLVQPKVCFPIQQPLNFVDSQAVSSDFNASGPWCLVNGASGEKYGTDNWTKWCAV